MLATMLLIAYNHEKFIEKSLNSALSQDYRPLQIIIWNNNSNDKTHDLIESVIKYHDIDLDISYHNSDYNYYPGFHVINSLMSMARGQYHILMSCDDISAPNRVSETMNVFLKTGAGALSTSGILIDENDTELETYSHLEKKPEFKLDFTAHDFVEVGGSPACWGPGLAWHRDVFDKFGPLRDGARNADVMIPFRGALIGNNTFITKRLVYRRLHDSNISLPVATRQSVDPKDKLVLRERSVSNRVANWVSIRDDIRHYAKTHMPRADTEALLSTVDKRIISTTRKWIKIRHEMMMSGVGIV